MAGLTAFQQTDPGLNEQYMEDMRQQALAQALMQQGQSPIQQVAGAPISPISVLAKGLAAYQGAAGMQAANHNLAGVQSKLATSQLNALQQLLGGGQPSTLPQADPSSQPQANPAPATPDTADGFTPPNGGNGTAAYLAAQPPAGGAAGFPAPQQANPGAGNAGIPVGGANRYMAAALMQSMGVAPEVVSQYLKDQSPTDQIKNDQWAGITPTQRAAIAGGVDMRPNQSRLQIGADGQPHIVAVAPDPSSNLQYSVGTNGNVSASPVSGVSQASADLAGAKTLATEGNSTTNVTLPNGSVVPVWKGPAATAGTSQAGLGQPAAPAVAPGTNNGYALGSQAAADAQSYKIIQQELRNAQAHGDQTTVAQLQREIAVRFPNGVQQQAAPAPQPMLGQPSGVATGAANAQQEMSQKWTQRSNAHSQAQTTISYLQNIKGLANQAIVGPMSSKLQFANSLLSLAGSQRATDAATASQLLDKYSNQIVSRLGQGSLGTDAARSIIQAANPNSHMNAPAIGEAVDNLVAANQMTQAKARYLAAPANARQPAQYNQREQVFDQYADPRVWQYLNTQDAGARRAFAQKTMAQDPHFANRLQALENMGALQ